jgi:hypothetical protein
MPAPCERSVRAESVANGPFATAGHAMCGGVDHLAGSATLGSAVFSITAIHHWLERA